jgi:hypothetical protein
MLAITTLTCIGISFSPMSSAATTSGQPTTVAAVAPQARSLPLEAMTPITKNLYDQYRWSLMYYYGVTVDNSLLQTMTLMHLKRWPEHIQTVELAHTLDQDNFLRRWLRPLVNIIQLAGNITVRNGRDEPTIYEFDPYLIFRWTQFPWNDYITTSLALGEGISYASSIPAIESKDRDNAKRLLNYMIAEATFSLPSYPRWQLVARVHHRSGVFGLYHAGNTGSNDIALGVRYLFD